MSLSEIIKMIEMEIANSDAEKLSFGKKLSDTHKGKGDKEITLPAIEKELPAIDDKSLDTLIIQETFSDGKEPRRQ